jgi:hypothetical protein
MNLRYKPGRHLKFNMHGAFGYGTFNWLKVLYKNRFRIDLAEIPKVLWITSSILSTNVFRLYEKIRYKKAIQKVQIKEPVFILGYPRSGTTFLHYLISKDEQFGYCATYQVLMPNVFLTMGGFLEKFLRGVLPKTRLMDNLKMGTKLPKEEEFAMSAISDASMINGFYFPKNIMRYFQRYVLFEKEKKNEEEWKKKYLYFLKKVALKEGNKRLLLKSPFNTGRIKQLLEIFPDAKFIHIHRNPYEVYYSNEKLYEKVLPAFSFHEAGNSEIEKFILDSYRLTYQKYQKEISLIPKGNIAVISYEELVTDPMASLQRVYMEAGLTDFKKASASIEQELSTYKNYQTNFYVMDEEVNQKVYDEWKYFFKEFGYEQKDNINQLQAV